VLFTVVLLAMAILMIVFTSISTMFLFIGMILLIITIGFGYYTYHMYIEKSPIVKIEGNQLMVKQLVGIKTMDLGKVDQVYVYNNNGSKYIKIKGYNTSIQLNTKYLAIDVNDLVKRIEERRIRPQ